MSGTDWVRRSTPIAGSPSSSAGLVSCWYAAAKLLMSDSKYSRVEPYLPNRYAVWKLPHINDIAVDGRLASTAAVYERLNCRVWGRLPRQASLRPLSLLTTKAAWLCLVPTRSLAFPLSPTHPKSIDLSPISFSCTLTFQRVLALSEALT